jgi:creatinine amidohydrolase
MTRRWDELTSPEFAALDPVRTVAVLPVGAIEQHGPHLPVGVDAMLVSAAVERLMARAPAERRFLVLPVLPIGKSNEHAAFPGTLSLSFETLTRLWLEVGESVARAGLRKLLILNSHGGQIQLQDVVARELRVRQKMFVVTATLGAFGPARDLFAVDELRHGIHGGGVETSIMLHLHPALVRAAERACFTPTSVAIEREYRYLRPEGSAVGFGWQTQDLHTAGACGDALDADAERGRRVLDGAVEQLIELLAEIERFPLEFLRE